MQKGMLYEVKGEITDADKVDDKFATCVAVMANGPAFAKEAEGRRHARRRSRKAVARPGGRVLSSARYTATAAVREC